MIAFIPAKPSTQTLIAPSSLLNAEGILLSGLRGNDLPSFNRLYKMYSGSLMGVIMKIVDHQQTAEDLLQEVFVKVRKSLYTYDETKSRLFTWILHIARNTALDHLRKKSFKQEQINLVSEDAAQELEYHTHSFSPETIRIRKLLDQLSLKQKLVFDLAYYQGYTHEEIAQKLDVPVGSVKTCLRLAILKLRGILGETI